MASDGSRGREARRPHRRALDAIGTDPDGTLVQGANDNASGPGVTIEVARALASRKAGLIGRLAALVALEMAAGR